MADHRITDFVDPEAIESLNRLNDEMLKVRDTYVRVADQLVAGLKMKVEGFGDLDRLIETYNRCNTEATQATRQLSVAVDEQQKVIAKTTAQMAEQLQEQAKVNEATRQSKVDNEKVRSILEQVNGTYDQRLKRLLEVQQQMKQNQEALKNLEKGYKDGRISGDAYNEAMFKITKTQRELAQEKSTLTKRLQNEEREMNSVEGSYNHLSQQLELVKKAYKDLTTEEKASEFGKEMLDTIQQLDTELKYQAEAMGEHQRNVGDYAINTKKELKEAVMEIASMTVAYRSMSEEERNSAAGQELQRKLQAATEKAGALKDAILDVNKSIKNAASDSRKLDSAVGGLKLMVDGFGAAKGAAALLGIEEKSLIKVQTQLQAAMAASNALRGIQNALQKESAVMMGITAIQTKAAAIAENIKAAAIGKGTIALAAATVAQKAFNLVAKANPYILLATAIIGVVTALKSFVGQSEKSRKEEEAAQKAAEEHKKRLEILKQKQKEFSDTVVRTVSDQLAAYFKLREEWKRIGDNLAKQNQFIKDNKKHWDDLGIAVRSVHDAEVIFDQMTNKVVLAYIKRGMAAAYAAKAQKLIDEYVDVATTPAKYMPLKKGATWGDLSPDEVTLLGGMPKGKSTTVVSPTTGTSWTSTTDPKTIKLTANQIEIVEGDRKGKALEKKENLNKAYYDKAVNGSTGLYRLSAELDKEADALMAGFNKKTPTDPTPSSSSGSSSNSTSSSSSSKPEPEKGKTLDELQGVVEETTLEVLQNAVDKFEAGSDEWKGAMEALINFNKDKSIADAKDELTAFLKDAEKSRDTKTISEAEFNEVTKEAEERYAQLEKDYEEAATLALADVADKHKKYLENRAKEEKEALEKEQAQDMDAYAAFYAQQMLELQEQKKRELQWVNDANIPMEIKQREIAETETRLAKEAAEATAAYSKTVLDQQIADLKELLEIENLSADEREKIQAKIAKMKMDLDKKVLDYELEAIKAEADAQKKAADDQKKAMDARLKNITDWVNRAKEALSAVSDLANAIYDGKIAKIEEEQEAEEEAAQREDDRISELVEKKVITEEEGEARKRAAAKETAKRQEQLEKKKKEAQYKQAVWQKANNISQAAMATALAVLNALNTKPFFPLGLAMAATAGTMGALQIATILATPIPKYAKGTDKHPGGLAFVGDAYRPELVESDGQYWVTPSRPTLVDLPEGAAVYPDVNALARGMFTESGPRMSGSPSPSVVVNNDYSRLEKSMNRVAWLQECQLKQNRQLAYDMIFEDFKRRKGL